MSIAPRYVDPVLRSYRIRNKVTTPAAGPAIDLTKLKKYLRITSNDDDALLADLIEQATDVVQQFLSRTLITTGYTGFADRNVWPSTWWEGMITAPIGSVFQPTRVFEIPWMPMKTFTSLFWVDLSGGETLVDPSQYIVDLSSQDRYGRVALKYFAAVTVPAQEINAYKFVWTSGYGAAPSDIPAGITSGLNRVAAFMYQNRGDCGCEGSDIITASGAASAFSRYQALRI